MVFLHGFPDHPPTATGFLDELAAAGYEIVAPWMRGYAPSPLAGPYDGAQLGADAIAIADAVAGDRPVHLVGHDWGALVTYAACAIAPARFARAVAMAVPHPRAFVASLARTAQLARSWYMLAFQLPGAPAVARARDLALIDWLWRAWSPGFALPDEARAALHQCLAASLPAPIGYYRALLSLARARPGVARRPPDPPDHRADLAAPGCGRWLHRAVGGARPGAVLHRPVPRRGRRRRGALPARRGSRRDRRARDPVAQNRVNAPTRADTRRS